VIDLIENYFPVDMYEDLLVFLEKVPMRFGAKSDATVDPYGHWHVNFTNTDRFSKTDASDRLIENLVPVWKYVRDRIPNKVLVTSYMNGHTYGTEGYFHEDSETDDYRTVIVYLTRDRWDPNHGGETVFIDSDDVVRGCIYPRYNRVISFPSNIRHCARGVTRKYAGLRKTLMFKTRM
jgi:SM-20-related protein